MMETVSALVLGSFFGWMLHKAGLTHYARIVGVFRLRDMTVIRFILTALVVASVLLQVAVGLGITHALPIPKTALLANLVGGIVFGVGMATAGYCTGTVVAQAGEGRLDAWIGGLSGLVVGAIVFGLVEPLLMPILTRAGSLGRVTFASLLGASPWLVLMVFVEVVALVLYLIGRSRSPDQRPKTGSQTADKAHLGAPTSGPL